MAGGRVDKHPNNLISCWLPISPIRKRHITNGSTRSHAKLGSKIRQYYLCGAQDKITECYKVWLKNHQLILKKKPTGRKQQTMWYWNYYVYYYYGRIGWSIYWWCCWLSFHLVINIMIIDIFMRLDMHYLHSQCKYSVEACTVSLEP